MGSIAFLVVLAISGLVQAWLHTEALGYGELFRLWLSRLPIAASLVWLALYASRETGLAKRLEEVGAAAVMPLAAPIGSGRGLKMAAAIAIIIEQATVPVVVDAGLGVPSHAAAAMEMGADAVLVNTAIAIASDPVRMAKAFKKAIEAGREAREIGLAEKLSAAAATSPLTGFLTGR